jgi:hypothetical protein
MNDLFTTRQRRQFAAAQAAYENRAEPELSEDAPVPFSSDWADAYIDGLAKAEDGFAYLDTDCIDLGEKGSDVADLLKALAVASREKPEVLHALIGSQFFRTMKELAMVAYGNQQ